MELAVDERAVDLPSSNTQSPRMVKKVEVILDEGHPTELSE